MNQEVKQPHVVRIHVDQQSYESPTPTTGSELYRFVHVPAGQELLREVHGSDVGRPIANDQTRIELENGERFRTGPPKPTGVTIYVNTAPVVWERPEISYDELVKLAFPDGPFGGNVRYTITWTRPDGSEGAVLKGGKIDVVNEMAFDVRNTDKS